MEKHLSKRRRVFSNEPNKLVRALFVRKYVNHLLPALMKVNAKKSSDENDDYELEKIVRHEVDMALVMSAEGYAWSHALKGKLQRNVNVGSTTHNSFMHNLVSPNQASEKVGDRLPWPCVQNTMVPMKFLPNPSNKPKIEKLKRSKILAMPPRRKREAAKEREEEQISSQLTNLRNILPGGNEMGDNDHEMLTEVGSYIMCLELQVNILRCLVETH